MSPPPYQRVEGHEGVVKAFGYWPRFHDAEVCSLILDRNTPLCEGVADARIELCLHAFEWTSGEKPRFNHHLVRLRFYDVRAVKLEDFNHQNALLELRLEEATLPDSGFRVTFIPAHGLFGSFGAATAQVLSVVPCDEKGQPRQEAEPAHAA